MKIKLVIFDADNTLIDFPKCERFGLEYAFNHFNIKLSDKIANTFSKIDNTLWSKGSWEGIEFSKESIPTKRFKLLFEIYKLSPVEYNLLNEFFMEGFSKAIFPLKESHEIIEYLYKNRFTICVATNGLIRLQYPRIKNTSFGHYITQIVTSEEVLENKPGLKIFKKILKDNNVKESEAIMIGDSLLNDIKGAKDANIAAVWYNPNQETNQTNIFPDYTMASMNELKEILKKDFNK